MRSAKKVGDKMKPGFAKILTILMFMTGLAFAQVPTVEEVRGMVRDVRLPEDQAGSLSFDMYMNLPMPLSILCQLRYSAPDKYSLQVFDNYDQTPVLIIIGQTAMINDPFADGLTLIASAGVAFDLVPRGSEYNAQFAFNMPVDGEIKNRVELDFKTMFSRVSENVTVESAASDTVLFSGLTEQKSRCVALFAPNEKFALRELALFVEEEQAAVLALKNIRVDSETETVAADFPMLQLASSAIPLNFIEPQGMIDTAMVATTVIKAVFARSAIRNQPLREKLESMINQKIDWASVAASDAVRSEKLRQIFRLR
ncbi:MAG: hypothetical protein ACD_39C01985G0002 [uncultured bacterium]|nr:MAG: hypothetical protein ACD_39C01985G0002 [uncultured bacterium]